MKNINKLIQDLSDALAAIEEAGYSIEVEDVEHYQLTSEVNFLKEKGEKDCVTVGYK